MADVADNLWDECARAARAAAEAVRRDGVELCARMVFRTSRNELRRAGIATPAALYDELKQVFWNADEGVSLGDHLSVRFGKTDRRCQVRAFANRHACEPRNVVAKAYEREYGFSAGIVAIWLDLFAETADVSVSEWLGRGRQDNLPVARESATDIAEESMEEAPAVNEEGALEGFFDRELNADICDAKLVRGRFAYEFRGVAGVGDFEREVSKAGYFEDHGVLFRDGHTLDEHFARLIEQHPSFARGDAGFEDAVWKHPVFRRTLKKALGERRVLLYEPDSYLSFSRLHAVLGIQLTDIESYAASVMMLVPEYEPFTVASLRTKYGFEHALNQLEMPDAFYEGLLNSSDLFRSCVLAGSRVFVAGGEGRFSAIDFIEWLVAQHEGIERDSLPGLLVEELGISCSTALLTTTLYNSGVYYDDIGDAYYSSMDTWKKEALNGLA